MKQDKGLVYLLLRAASVAETELKAVKDEGVSGFSGSDFASSIDKNLSLFNENQTLFDELFITIDISTTNDLQNLTQQELSELGIEIVKFE